jgi:hypothetical protein
VYLVQAYIIAQRTRYTVPKDPFSVGTPVDADARY